VVLSLIPVPKVANSEEPPLTWSTVMRNPETVE
jgi:hypothetical protein